MPLLQSIAESIPHQDHTTFIEAFIRSKEWCRILPLEN